MVRNLLDLPLHNLPINIPSGREAVLAWLNKEPVAYLQVAFVRKVNVKSELEADSAHLEALHL